MRITSFQVSGLCIRGKFGLQAFVVVLLLAATPLANSMTAGKLKSLVGSGVDESVLQALIRRECVSLDQSKGESLEKMSEWLPPQLLKEVEACLATQSQTTAETKSESGSDRSESTEPLQLQAVVFVPVYPGNTMWMKHGGQTLELNSRNPRMFRTKYTVHKINVYARTFPKGEFSFIGSEPGDSSASGAHGLVPLSDGCLWAFHEWAWHKDRGDVLMNLKHLRGGACVSSSDGLAHFTPLKVFETVVTNFTVE
jgi:hypothetical protein